jgi:NhaP-type Na+/H+ or K+/H+ antiporter
MESTVLVIALSVLVFGLVAGRLHGTPCTLPMVFTALGLLLGPSLLGVLQFEADDEAVAVLAEATLALVLFTDASRMDADAVRRDHSLAQRLLVVGMPLAIVFGTVVGLVLLPDLPVAVVAVLAAVLAPTDAALGQAFVEDEHVPARIRQTLNVESGLNDGLAVPFVTLLLDVARSEADDVVGYAVLVVSLVGIGAGVGAFVGWAGGRLLEAATRHGWTTATTQRLAVVALAAVAFAGAESLGGNGFVAAFVGGLVVGTSARQLLPHTTAFAQAEGQLLTLLTFLVFGAVVTGDLVADADIALLLYAVASLLLVRPLAVVISLLGTGVRPSTGAFLAWGGPRGLASIVYAVLVLGTPGVPQADVLFAAAGLTVLLSIYLHGATAAPASRWYARRISGAADGREHQPVRALPVRLPASPREPKEGGQG